MLDEIWRAGHLGSGSGRRGEDSENDSTGPSARTAAGWQRLGFGSSSTEDSRSVDSEGNMFREGGELALQCLVRAVHTSDLNAHHSSTIFVRRKSTSQPSLPHRKLEPPRNNVHSVRPVLNVLPSSATITRCSSRLRDPRRISSCFCSTSLGYTNSF